MDPHLFGMDGEFVAQVLSATVLLSRLIRSAKSLLFDGAPLV